MDDIRPGWVWTPGGKGKFRPFVEFREIRRGKNKGRFQIIIREQKMIVDRGAIKSFPVNKNLQMKLGEVEE